MVWLDRNRRAFNHYALQTPQPDQRQDKKRDGREEVRPGKGKGAISACCCVD